MTCPKLRFNAQKLIHFRKCSESAMKSANCQPLKTLIGILLSHCIAPDGICDECASPFPGRNAIEMNKWTTNRRQEAQIRIEKNKLQILRESAPEYFTQLPFAIGHGMREFMVGLFLAIYYYLQFVHWTLSVDLPLLNLIRRKGIAFHWCCIWI